MPADRTSSTAEQLRKSWFGAKSGRPVNAINPITALMQAELDPRRTNGGSVRPEDRNTCPSPEVLQLQQRANQLQLELARIERAVQLQQRADQLQLELERTKKDLSLTKQGFELDGVFGNKADIVSETNIINKVKSLNDCIYQLASEVTDAHTDNDIQLSENRPSNHTKSFFGESLCNLFYHSEFDSILNPEKTQESQPKAASARWRAYSDTQALKQDQQFLFALLTRHLSRLYGFPEEQLRSVFEEDFSNLINETMDLRKMMHGDYASGKPNVKVFAPLPGSEFDPEKMQADDPTGRTPKPAAGPIMCTTAIGITQTLYIRRGQGGERVDEKEHNVLSRANVVVSFDN